MPILGADFQGNQPVNLGVIEVLKKLTQPQMPPPTQEEQAIRMKTKAIGSLVNDFSGSLGSIGEDTKKSLTQSFMKSLLNPPTESLVGGKIKGTPEAKTPQALPALKTETGQQENKPNILWEVLKRAGLPALATILGSTGAMPLAGAAGLGTGYVKGMETAEETKLKYALEPLWSYNPDTGKAEDTGLRLPKGAQIRNLTSEKTSELNAAIADLVAKKLGESTKSPSEITEESKKTREEIKKKHTKVTNIRAVE